MSMDSLRRIPINPDAIIKRCPCGRAFTQRIWDLLQRPQKGDRILSEDETGRYVTHLRNCLCGSTIALEEQLP